MQGQSPSCSSTWSPTLSGHLSFSEGRGCRGARFPFLGGLLGLSLHILIGFPGYSVP